MKTNTDNTVLLPYISKNGGPFWYVITHVLVILGHCMRQTFIIRSWVVIKIRKSEFYDKPRGVTACHLIKKEDS